MTWDQAELVLYCMKAASLLFGLFVITTTLFCCVLDLRDDWRERR